MNYRIIFLGLKHLLNVTFDRQITHNELRVAYGGSVAVFEAIKYHGFVSAVLQDAIGD